MDNYNNGNNYGGGNITTGIMVAAIITIIKSLRTPVLLSLL